MSSTASIPSTERLASFSVGASPTGSMKRWAPSPYKEELCVTWGFPTQGKITHTLSWTNKVTGNEFYLAPEQVVRIICHAYIDLLPDAALSELVETLKSIEEFYKDLTPLYALPESTSFVAKLSDTFERPTFAITED